MIMDSILALNHKPVIQAVVIVLVSFKSSSSRQGHLGIFLPEDALLLEHNYTNKKGSNYANNYTNNEEKGSNHAIRCSTAIT